MVIVLVNAPPLGILEPWYDAAEFPRGALANLAAYLMHRGYTKVYCIDAKFERLNFNETLTRILSYKPDIVGFTAFTNEIKPCGYLAYKVKQQTNCLTVAGGAHPSAMPEATLREFPGFDCVAIGDGEEILLQLCNAIAQGEDVSTVNGICYRKNDLILRTEDQPRILDQDALPMPAWHLMPRGAHYWLQSAKGCPFKCVFCMNHNGRVVRKRSVEKTIEEVRFVLDTYKPEWIRFGDEIFTADRERTIHFLKAWIKEGFAGRVKWDVQTHVKYVDREMLALFKQAGITQLDMGIESGDEQLLKHMGKATNQEMIIEAFKMAHEMGIKTGSLLLLGQPNETVETMRHTINLAVKINSALPMFGVMMPLPGTEVAKMAAKGEGGYKSFSTNWDEYRKNVGISLEFSNFDRATIDRMQFEGFIKVFLHNLRFFELAKFIWKYKYEGWLNVKKLFFRDNNVRSYFTLMPTDYEAIMALGITPTPEDIVGAKETFNKIQSKELKRTNREMPNLIKEQQPVG